ncbi:hypothetical protein [Lentzea sp. NPDC092896]|uniref:hypothetical protein n=1 Tax=Lentzea sp. NPDC092896 TaxID=3364127 RepID=UPI0037F1D98B
MTEIHFDATPVGDGVLVRISEENAAVIVNNLDAVLRLFVDGEVLPHFGRWWRTPSAEELRRRMFPVSDEFWARHRETLIDPGPAQRVRERVIVPTPWVLGFDEVEDWIVAFAQMRALYQRWKGATIPAAQVLSGTPAQLVVALHPSSATGWPD